jgi:phage terminase large subunit GpA-like protein
MLDMVTGADSLPAAIYGALTALVGKLAGQDWPRDSGGIKTMDRILIDANWSQSTNTVYQFCRESMHRNILTPSHGKFVGPQNVPFSEHAVTKTDQIGLEFKIITNTAKRSIPYCLIDTNFWKSFMADRWGTAKGGAGSLTLFGSRPVMHQMFADHQTAEFRTPTAGRGRRVDVWELKPGRPDNDWLDCVVGCGVGASMEGITLAGTQAREDRSIAASKQWSAFLGGAKRRG